MIHRLRYMSSWHRRLLAVSIALGLALLIAPGCSSSKSGPTSEEFKQKAREAQKKKFG